MKKNISENKSERFKRLAEKRTRRVLEDLRILSNLANKGMYECDSSQIRKIFSAIRDSMTKAEARFRGEEEKKIDFKL